MVGYSRQLLILACSVMFLSCGGKSGSGKPDPADTTQDATTDSTGQDAGDLLADLAGGDEKDLQTSDTEPDVLPDTAEDAQGDAQDDAATDTVGDAKPEDLSDVDPDDKPECTADSDCNHLVQNACQTAACNKQTGTCEVSPLPNCTPCTTVQDCPVAPMCHAPLCDSGRCAVGFAEAGTPCDDNDHCTQTDTCQQGSCVGENPIVCTALDQCHVPGMCDPMTGVCSNPEAEANIPCNDGNLCTQTDTCQQGNCVGEDPIVCAALDQCHVPGICDPATGVCSNPEAQQGTACEDGDLCTLEDSCAQGACASGQVMNCKDTNQCTADYCQQGQCENPAIEGCVPEDCVDNVDNNNNDLIDCDDPLCVDDAVCQPLAVGETCGLPYLVNDGVAVGQDAIGLVWSFDGDNTGKSSDYPALCWQGANVPDEVFKVVVTEPVRLRVSFNYVVPHEVKYSRIMIFKDVCFPDNFMTCAYGGSVPADHEDVFLPGTYYFVVTGSSYYQEDWGPYTFQVEVYTVETTETECQDDIDNDGNGLADCADPQCYQTEGCEELPVLDDLGCGDTWTGQFLSIDESHYFTFTLPQAGNVAVYWAFPEGAKDYGYINFYEATTNPPRFDELWGTGETVWHTGTGAGFKAKANKLYVAMFELSKLDQGSYNFTLACSTVPEFNCDDSLDNDADGYADCEDPDCFDLTACNGGFSGEDCTTAIPIYGGVPITAVDIGDTGLSYTLLGRNDTKANNLAASCVAATASGPDIVYTFTLEDYAQVGISAQFQDEFSKVPAVYLFQEQCVAANLLGCGEPMFFITGMTLDLGPGTYFVVVDSGGVNFSNVPHQGPFILDIYIDPPAVPELCSNLDDDDGDGRIDCQDPECFDEEVCVGFDSGEHCGDAFRINDGVSLPADYAATFYNTTIGKGDELGYSCAPVSWDGPDTAHYFYLEEPRTLTLRLQFDDGFTPALILFGDGGCGASTILHCITAEWDTVTLSELELPAGHYHIVVDSGDELFGKPMANHYSLWMTTVTEVCDNQLDDDGDGRIDCQDSRCFGLEACTGALTGEDCTTAFQINAAQPLTVDQEYEVMQTTVAKSNDLSEACSQASLLGGDSVHTFTLDAQMWVSASVQFDNQTYPAISLYAAGCSSESLLGCDVGTWSVAALDALLLGPGVYFVVVDSGQAKNNTPNASDYILTVSTQGL